MNAPARVFLVLAGLFMMAGHTEAAGWLIAVGAVLYMGRS